ncbi:N-acetylmuramoyl-L-alanine amidase [Ornithinibacillus bavariensis]|uniref:N-acetylmuramoyl-L-alanine amidase n=1 Tax=Ornithinibacillus bavariensis TaxID=545502 RepID=UPI000ED72FCD|nr:N-acetylmuramoyl-L-alanine amidase [Ornithinibacillus sp.]
MRIHRIIALTLCLILLTIHSTVIAQGTTAIVTQDNLNVRSGPGTNYDRIGQLNTNETYPILTQQDGWVEMQLDGFSGWVSTDYISIQGHNANQSEETMAESDNRTIVISQDKTQIRNGPSTENDIVSLANKGQAFDVIGETDEWLKVKSEEVEGYVYKKLIDATKGRTFTGLKGKTIVLDPGHGGDDSGAIGANDTLEKNITYKTAEGLAEELTMLGAEVILTRDQETFVSLSSRANMANVFDTDAFISLHYNSVPDIPDATGISTYYFHEQFKPLANYIQQELIKETGDRDRLAEYGDFQVIRQNLKPGVLIELGFISNPEIEQLLLTNAYQKKLVSGIVNGLQRYFAGQ